MNKIQRLKARNKEQKENKNNYFFRSKEALKWTMKKKKEKMMNDASNIKFND